MADDLQGKTLSRRNVLKVLAGAAGVAARGPTAPLIGSEAPHCAVHAARPISTLTAATESAPKFLSSDQIRTLTVLTEVIIPADEHSPGAATAGVPAYIDSVLAQSPDERKNLWTQGLAAIDRIANADFARPFADCTASQHEQLLLKFSANEDSPTTPEEKFFVAIKNMTIEGYYNSSVGLHKDLEYQGNEALGEFEGCTHPEHGAPAPGKS
jgi:hypothetical protein